ncbi:PKD domain-containing protein [Geodermatophilus sp. Leaf369]|uniref:PKD domain-containing protein n=1 Tax=Geodermatophilus sp. Leaf369 TaxID=1736354 RepID=UPI001F170BC7|nr:PKD domain-containing protein [Geodermatophilus sp. Leaf369]
MDPASPATPTTVAADALPTVQINGVAWAQVVVGDTVYVAGRFTSARPAGAAAGTQETPRGNLLAYDIRTGVLINSWAPSLNAQALTLAASPDGSRIYVGGDFTTVNGTSRNRIAALSATTGALIAGFAPSVSSQVRAIAVTDSKVYIGGSFATVGGVARARLAALQASNGALLPWNPTLQAGPTDRNNDPGKTATQNAQTSTEVMALLVVGSGTRVVAAGRFDQLNNVKSTGVGALDATTGATLPFAVNQQITNQGINSAVYSLTSDGTNVYGTAYDFYGPGNLEGAFAAAVDGGAPVWFNSCLGDTYSSFPSNGTLYQATHAHNCGPIDGYPEQNPRVNKFGTAVSLAATGRSTGDFNGQPSPSLLSWFPAFSAGTVTGQYQAGWTVTGNSQYVVFGGEFPRVNGTAQAGLVRFAAPAIAPNKVGPVYDAAMKPTPIALPGGAVRLSWPTTWDYDNQTLTYDVYRSDRPSTVLGTVTAASQWWQRPTTGFVDRTAVPGAAYTYKVNVRDPFGNQYRSGNSVSVTVSSATAPAGLYAETVTADQPSHYWRFGEAAGSPTGFDQTGFDDLRIDSGVTLGAPGALSGNPDTSGSFSGAPSGLAATTTPVTGPQVFSVEAWFQTTSATGGKIIGFGSSSTGDSGSYDRHVYMDASGRVTMGVYDGNLQTVTTPGALNDGTWHHVVGTYGSGAVALYVDGELVGTRTGATGAQAYSGFWRVGGDNTWAGANYFAGRIDEVAVYPTVLTPTQVRQHHAIGATGTTFNTPPTAAFTATAAGLAVSLDGSTSVDPDGSVTRWSWAFGDGTTGDGANVRHTYDSPGSYRVTLTVTDARSGTAAVTHVIAVVRSGVAGSDYSRAVLTDAPEHYWRLNETTGDLLDSAGGSDLTVNAGVARGVPGAIASDQDLAARFDGVSGLAATQTAVAGPSTFSLEAWFQTTSTAGGKIIGFGNRSSGTSSSYDRHVYLSPDGTVRFGAYSGQLNVVSSASGYNDGRWHHVVATIGSGGMRIYVDGQAGTTSPNTASEGYAGYWRVGGDSSWDGAPYFNGSIDDVAVYPVALTAAQAAAHHALGVAAANAAPTASFTSSVTDLSATFDASASSDPDGQVAGLAWDFGDGTTGTGATTSHDYATPGTYRVTLVVTDDRGATASTTAQVTVQARPNAAPVAVIASSVSGLSARVDGSASTDAEGPLASWAWDLGDGTTATGPVVTHDYATGGTYTVSLRVTDQGGAVGNSTASVTVVSPPPTAPTAIASDTFNRTATGGLGTADVGGAWTATAGAARQSVTPGTAVFATTPGTNTGSVIAAASGSSVSVRTTVTLSSLPSAGAASVYVTGRRSSGQEYAARVRFLANGAVGVAAARLTGTTSETLIGSEVIVPGLTYTAGTPLAVRFDITGTGTTTLAVTVSAGTATPPATPVVTRTDATAALQVAGQTGLLAYLSGSAAGSVAVRFSAYSVTPVS